MRGLRSLEARRLVRLTCEPLTPPPARAIAVALAWVLTPGALAAASAALLVVLARSFRLRLHGGREAKDARCRRSAPSQARGAGMPAMERAGSTECFQAVMCARSPEDVATRCYAVSQRNGRLHDR
jgi:hypothetical protein